MCLLPNFTQPQNFSHSNAGVFPARKSKVSEGHLEVRSSIFLSDDTVSYSLKSWHIVFCTVHTWEPCHWGSKDSGEGFMMLKVRLPVISCGSHGLGLWGEHTWRKLGLYYVLWPDFDLWSQIFSCCVFLSKMLFSSFSHLTLGSNYLHLPSEDNALFVVSCSPLPIHSGLVRLPPRGSLGPEEGPCSNVSFKPASVHFTESTNHCAPPTIEHWYQLSFCFKRTQRRTAWVVPIAHSFVPVGCAIVQIT